MPRLFFHQTQISAPSVICITGDEVHHLRVMRLKPGDFIYISDGSGHRYKALIISMTRAQAELEIQKSDLLPRKSRPKFILGQAIPRFAKMEFILQKATELGVDDICPLQTERSFLPRDRAFSQNRWHRWKRIVSEAAKQSGRTDVPALSPPRTLDSFLEKKPDPDLKICLWEGGDPEKGIKDILRAQKKPDAISLLIGPEGSFSENEIERIRSSGYRTLSCGPRIMRVETAALACMGICQYEWGDM